ncbi:MAG: ABC transporter permease, partial [Casimicrobiaceae bacterium]
MTARRIFAIARKEIVDSARDRRTLLVALLTAVAAGPIFLILIFNLIARQADSARELKLPAIGLSNAPALEAFLVRNQVTLSEAPADYEAKIRTGEINVV